MDSGGDRLAGLAPSMCSYWVCDLRQITQLLRTSVSSSIKWDNTSIVKLDERTHIKHLAKCLPLSKFSYKRMTVMGQE